MHPVLFPFCYCASGPNPGKKKKVTPMKEHPREANCCINSGHINKEISSIKSSVVFCRGCAHRWLCAQCQKPHGNRRNGPLRSRNSTQTRWRACLASVYDSLPKERKSWKGGVCSVLLGGWQEQGKKSEWDVGVKNLMSSHGLPYPQRGCRQAGTSPEQHHMLPVSSCNFWNRS